MNELKVIYLKEADEFIASLPQKDRMKVFYNVDQVMGGDRSERLFRKLEGSEIWEFRTDYNGNAYRLLAFWDREERSLVVATHGFSKKAQKTPKKEIKKAENIRLDYFKTKNK